MGSDQRLSEGIASRHGHILNNIYNIHLRTMTPSLLVIILLLKSTNATNIEAFSNRFAPASWFNPKSQPAKIPETKFVNFGVTRTSEKPSKNGSNIKNTKGSRSTAVLQFLEKVLKLKNKSLEFPKRKMNVQTLHKREQKYSPPKEKKDRATALEKLFFIAGGADWDSQFQKEKKPAMEEVKRVASFICPEAEGVFGDPEDCAIFIRCVHSRPIRNQC